MKIAMLGHKVIPSTRGGIETVLTNLCPRLVKKGASVVCYNRSSDKVEPGFAEMVKGNDFEGVQLKKARTINSRGFAAMISSFTGALACCFSKYDIVHFHAEGPCAAMWLTKFFGKKCVSTVHGLDWQREKWGSGFASKYIKFGEKMLVKYSDEIIVLSESAKKYFEDTYCRRTNIIPNGINRPEKIDPNEITEKFGLLGNDYICLASRLTEEKGVHFLIDAFKQIKTDKKLVICGDTSDTDDYVKMLREMAAGDDRIIFTGFISGNTLAEMYSNAYIVSLPSTIEGMSLSLLEALAYGNAVVCSDIPENTSVCDDYAVTFKKGNVEDLREKLTMLLEDPQKTEEYKSRAADYICNKYSWEKTVDMTYDLYNSVIKGKDKR